MKLAHVLGLVLLGLVGATAYTYFNSQPYAPLGAPLPTTFTIEQQAQLIGGQKFNIVSAGRQYGTIEEVPNIGSAMLEYRNNKGAVIAMGHKPSFSWPGTIDVFDATGSKIGSIKERQEKLVDGVTNSYQILDARGSAVAASEKFELFTTDVNLFDLGKRRIARFNRGTPSPSDRWKVEVNLPGHIDERVLILIAAFKSVADSKR